MMRLVHHYRRPSNQWLTVVRAKRDLSVSADAADTRQFKRTASIPAPSPPLLRPCTALLSVLSAASVQVYGTVRHPAHVPGRSVG